MCSRGVPPLRLTSQMSAELKTQFGMEKRHIQGRGVGSGFRGRHTGKKSNYLKMACKYWFISQARKKGTQTFNFWGRIGVGVFHAKAWEKFVPSLKSSCPHFETPGIMNFVRAMPQSQDVPDPWGCSKVCAKKVCALFRPLEMGSVEVSQKSFLRV